MHPALQSLPSHAPPSMIIPLNLRSIPYRYNRFIDGLIMASMVMAEEADMVDVLVIGAGPGGGSAAIHSARAGLKTCLLYTSDAADE